MIGRQQIRENEIVKTNKFRKEIGKEERVRARTKGNKNRLKTIKMNSEYERVYSTGKI